MPLPRGQDSQNCSTHEWPSKQALVGHMQTRTVFELCGAQLHAPIEQLLGNSEVKLLQQSDVVTVPPPSLHACAIGSVPLEPPGPVEPPVAGAPPVFVAPPTPRAPPVAGEPPGLGAPPVFVTPPAPRAPPVAGEPPGLGAPPASVEPPTPLEPPAPGLPPVDCEPAMVL